VWLSLDFEILPLSLFLIIVNEVVKFSPKPANPCKLEGKKKRVLNVYYILERFQSFHG